MNVEIGAEAAQFPEKEYINGIAFAVQGCRARHDFSRAWLEAEWNFSEGGLAQLKGNGFKKGCVLIYLSSSDFESTDFNFRQRTKTLSSEHMGILMDNGPT